MLLSQYVSQPNTKYMEAVKRVLHYLKGTRDLKLIFRRSHGSPGSPGSQRLLGYADSDFAGDIDDRRSVSGYVFTLNGNTISWRSKKRAGKVYTSTTEAELHAMGYASKHMLWLQEGLSELQMSECMVTTREHYS